MALDYAESIIQLLANLVALLLCLFHYISVKQKGWAFSILFFLSSLLSSYYWTSYLIIMGNYPNVSDVMAYFGWNGAFMILFVFLMNMKTPEERRYFHPLMLVPIPVNIFQLIMYLPYGRPLSNIYQVLSGTLVTVFSIQGFCWYWKNRKEGAPKPYISIAAFTFFFCEFGMWTSTCLEGILSELYFPFSFVCSFSYLLIVWAVRRTYSGTEETANFDQKYQSLLKAGCLVIVLGFSLGGILLGAWIRDQILEHTSDLSASNIYNIIPVVLFVISLVLVVFMVATIFVVYFGQRAAENNKLREARQIAERSNAAKSEFLANMSHEIRTPINAVMGMNEIILRESLQARDNPESAGDVRGIFSDISGYAGIIDSAGRNLLAIINDILDISKIEAGKLEIREGPYSLRAFLSDICRLISFRAQARNLEFRADVDPRLPDSINGDETRVRQVILNVLNNAVKYTNHGSVKFTVTGTPVSGYMPGQRVNLTFAVQDTGVGIRRKDLDRLFEKFERAGFAGSEQVEGTGLGLTISKNLLDMMGGTIEVKSEFGKGSLFTVTLPQKVVSTERIGEFDIEADPGTETEMLPQELFRAPDSRILVVDDTRMNLTVVEGLLRKTEVKIDTALSGEEALALTLNVPYDVILMDQRMYGMDGTEAMHRIREQEDGINHETPIVCLTADALAGVKEKYLAEGFTDYLSKPIDSLALKRTLLRHLPKDKVILLKEDEQNAPTSAPGPGTDTALQNTSQSTNTAAEPKTESPFAPLEQAGIHPARGLYYCQQDEALYRSLLAEFAAGAEEKEERLETNYASKNWKDYALLTHSLKSTSGTIGATALSENAAVLEAAANSEDIEKIRAEHEKLLELYRRTTEAIREFCTDDADDPFLSGSDGIIEFNPE